LQHGSHFHFIVIGPAAAMAQSSFTFTARCTYAKSSAVLLC